MGLFIGASILTVLEILDYIYEVHQPHSDQICSNYVQRNKTIQIFPEEPAHLVFITSAVATAGLHLPGCLIPK